MIDYKFDLYRAGSKIADLVELGKLSYGFRRNAFVPAQFDYNANSISPEVVDNLVEGSELRILRKGENDSDHKLIYAAEIKDPIKIIDSSNKKTYRIITNPWGNVFFKNRFPTKTYTSEEEEDIAWGIINDTQTDTKSGTFTASQVDFGITQGTLEITNNTRTKVFDEDEILKSLQQLADLEDTGVNPQKIRGFRLSPDFLDNDYHVFRYFLDYGITRDITFADNVIKSVKGISTFVNYANRILGSGSSSTTRQIVNSIDTADLDFFKMREKYFNGFNIQTDAELLDQVDDILRDSEERLTVWDIELTPNNSFVGQFRCGDIITVKYKDKIERDENGNPVNEGDEDGRFIDIDGQFIVFGIDITYNEKKIETVKLILSSTRPNTLLTNAMEKLISRVRSSNEQLTELGK